MEAKSQSFLLSKEAKTLRTKRITRLTDEDAYAEFVAIRFAENGGKPFCPWCCHRKVYSISTRNKWKCAAKACRRQFSATSQTIFASRKLPLETHQQRNILRGKVEIDGGYFGGHKRPKNNRPSRVDRRRLPHRTGKRQCVVIMRERSGRSQPFIMSEPEAAAIAHQHIEYGSDLYTDEGNHWIRLAAPYVLHMVNHSERYWDGDKCTNWEESYFARLHRAELGTDHHIAGPHLAEYANEISWREDRRRYSNKQNFDALAYEATHHPVSRKWKGYWQRRKAA